jgi:PAS domain S-box-containing protein
MSPRDSKKRPPRKKAAHRKKAVKATAQKKGPSRYSLLETMISRKKEEPFRTVAGALNFADQLIQTLRENFLVLSDEMIVLAASEKFYGTFQVSPAQTIGHSLYELGNHQWDIPALRTLLEKILLQRTSIENFRVEHDFPDIGRRSMLVNARVIRVKSGRPKFILLAFEDITEREAAIRELREQKDLFRLAIDTYPDSFIIYDPDRRIRFVNAYAQRLMKHSSEEMLGRRSEDLHPPETLPLFLPMQKKAFQEKRTITAERTIPFPGGTRTVQFTYVPLLDKKKQLVKMIGITHDMTERRRWERKLEVSEKRYRMLYEDSPAFKTVIGLDGTILDAGRTALKNLGYRKNDIVGRHFTEIIAPQQREMVKDLLNKALSGQAIPETDLLLLAKNGSLRSIMLASKYTPLYENDNINAFLFTGIDITDRKKIENQNIELNTKLQSQASNLAAANQELEAFVFSVSHEFGGPLRSIGGFSTILQEDFGDQLDEQAQKYLERIHRAADQMRDLMNHLLTLSRTIRQNIRRDLVDLCPLARNILEELRSSQPKRRVALTLPDHLIINGDKDLLYLVLHILMNNAWKFTKKRRQVKIELGAKEMDGRLIYYVKDNGVGFDMRYQDKLFMPFQRLHSSDDFPGTGLGLVVASRIIKRHQGEMWAEGKVGKGAAFYFTVEPPEEKRAKTQKACPGD